MYEVTFPMANVAVNNFPVGAVMNTALLLINQDHQHT